ncbi:MAG: hypothetical protein WCY68_14510 [Desulfuromonadales bacterium]
MADAFWIWLILFLLFGWSGEMDRRDAVSAQRGVSNWAEVSALYGPEDSCLTAAK